MTSWSHWDGTGPLRISQVQWRFWHRRKRHTSRATRLESREAWYGVHATPAIRTRNESGCCRRFPSEAESGRAGDRAVVFARAPLPAQVLPKSSRVTRSQSGSRTPRTLTGRVGRSPTRGFASYPEVFLAQVFRSAAQNWWYALFWFPAREQGPSTKCGSDR